jgi:DNA repair exonuclease SbcCD ATPase subunit
MMSNRWLRFPIAVSVMVILALTASLPPSGWVRAQPPRPEAAQEKAEPRPDPAGTGGWEFEEELTRTREDLENLKLWLTAKQAQLRAAEASTEVEHGIQSNYDRLLKKGMTSTLRQKVANLEVLEAESQKATIRAEIGDLQLRMNRTQRYLARLQQYGTVAMTPKDDRSLELTEALTRLKYAERAISKLQEELKDTKSELREARRGVAPGIE